MKKINFTKQLNGTSIAYLAIVAMFALLVGALLMSHIDSVKKDRDAIRIADITNIRNALRQYRDTNGQYPPCLYFTKNCKSLEGSTAMPAVPVDPLSNEGYSYAAIGSGKVCTGFHLGSSLERKGSQALLTGNDAPPVPKASLCSGSSPDFSGLSYAAGGDPCTLEAGTPQPTDSPDGETCYDLKANR